MDGTKNHSATDETVNIIYFLLPIALLLGLGFLAGFIFASTQGQFDDLETPAHRMLIDDEDHRDSKKGTTA